MLSAFGGMVAFCVIVGDTIPRVLDALFPSLADMSFLWLLTNRRAGFEFEVWMVVVVGIGIVLVPVKQLLRLTHRGIVGGKNESCLRNERERWCQSAVSTSSSNLQ